MMTRIRIAIPSGRWIETSVNDMVAELGVHPRTVSRALQRRASPPGEQPAARESKPDRYKPVIDRLPAVGV